MVGCSNAKRLGKELIKLGAAVASISAAGWRPTVAGVETLARLVREQIHSERPDFVVFQMLDNVLYMARGEDGTTSQPTLGEDGKHHVEGELVLAGKDVQVKIYRALRPVLAAVGNIPFILITPLPRYVVAPCCGNAAHVTNFSEPEYQEDLLGLLREVRANLRGCLYSDRARRVSLVDPTPVASRYLRTEDWEDPVHPGEATFRGLAEVTLDSVDHLDRKRKREEEGGGQEARPPWSRSTGNKPVWRGPSGSRGGGRGGRRGGSFSGGGRGWGGHFSR